jgi:hypothetical protein
MRRNRSSAKCPKCQAKIEPGYRFCLVCGASLEFQPQPAQQPKEAKAPAEPRSKRAGKKSPEAPISQMIASDFTYIRPDESAGHAKSNRSGKSSRWRALLVLLILVAGAIGGTTYWNQNHTKAEDKITWERISTYDYAGVWDRISDRSGKAGSDLKGIPGGAVKATVASIAEDGTIAIVLDGDRQTVRLAGIPEDFAGLCLGDRAMARIDRVLTEDAEIYVAHDGAGAITASDEPMPPVFIWREDPNTGKIRYLNQELIASGETDFDDVRSEASDSGAALYSAWMRAQQKQRGRFEAGACY